MCRRKAAQVLVSVDNDHGQIVHLQAQQSLESLRRFEGRFQALARRTFDAAFEGPVEEGAADILEALTQAVGPLVGFSRQHDEAPRYWGHLVHPGDHEVVSSHVQRVLCGKRDICAFRVTSADGELRWVSALIRPVRVRTDQDASYIYGLIKVYKAGFDAMPSSEEERTTSSAFHRFVCPASH